MKTFLLIGFNSTTSAIHCFCAVSATDLNEAFTKLGGRFALVKDLPIIAHTLFPLGAPVAKITPSTDTWARVATAAAGTCGRENDVLEAHHYRTKRLAANFDQFYVGQAPSL